MHNVYINRWLVMDLTACHLTLFTLFLTVSCFEPFNDKIRFDINWAGPVSLREGQVTPDGKDYLSSHDSVIVTTKDNEKYRCLMPEEFKSEEESSSEVEGSLPSELLKPLIQEKRCSYRLEPYWSYELCYGQHVRQFHDEKTPKGLKVQEYFLGSEQKQDMSTGPEPIDSPPVDEPKPKKVPTRRMNGRDMPYYEMVMGNGTPCDLLNGQPRETHIIFICHPHAQNEILSVKEVQTCVYEIEVLSPLLCASKSYRFQEEPIHQISCHSMDGSDEQPRSYVQFLEEQEVERLADTEEEDAPSSSQEHREKLPEPDPLLTRNFLLGDYCLHGGSGWWKYEFCYGKQVSQYHVEQNGAKTSILLGKWNKQRHLEWVKEKNIKASGYVSHFYSEGDLCDLTGKPRVVQVRLKCKESIHLQEMSLYLMEPQTCEYILGIESPIICPLLANADENGLFPVDD